MPVSAQVPPHKLYYILLSLARISSPSACITSVAYYGHLKDTSIIRTSYAVQNTLLIYFFNPRSKDTVHTPGESRLQEFRITNDATIITTTHTHSSHHPPCTLPHMEGRGEEGRRKMTAALTHRTAPGYIRESESSRCSI